MPVTIQEILLHISQLYSPRSETPTLDAQVLVAHCLGKPRAWVAAHSEAPLEPMQYQQIIQAARRLFNGEPLPYILGHWEFFGIDFQLTPEVLIPRPETELMVERALEWLRLYPHARKAIDVGTGCGCIGVALAMNIPDLHMLMTDISLPALDIARQNSAKYRLAERVEFQQANLLEGMDRMVDMICANLPYIPTQLLQELPVYQREPSLALDGGSDGLALIRRLLDQARGYLSPGGMMLLEIESSQGKEVKQIAESLYPAAQVQLRQDLAGKDRLLEIITSGLIVHLCQPAEWLEAKRLRYYPPTSLTQEGYIHCCQPAQIQHVANSYFQGVAEITLLWIDPGKLTSEIRWETSGEYFFPHIYGLINLAAVTSVTTFQAAVDSPDKLVPFPGK